MASDNTITIDCVESHATGVFRELMVMKERRRWTDFLINIDETHIPCHRNIICANSRMIRELLDDEEMPAAAKDAINLDHINLATMEKVLDFMYSGKISFRGDELKEYLEVAVNLKMDNLMTRCLDHVPSHITADNALGWFRLGFIRKLPELIDHAAQVIVQHFTEIASQHEFLTLDYPQVERCLRDALSDDTSGRVGRDNVLRSVIAWVSYGDDNRVAHLQDLINLVKPETCSSDTLLNIIQAHPAIISQNPAVMVALAAAVQHISKQDTERQAGREDRRSNPEYMDHPVGEDAIGQTSDGIGVKRTDGGAEAQIEDGAVAQTEGAMAQATLNVKKDGKIKGDVKEVSDNQDVKTKTKTQDKSTVHDTRRSKKLPVIIGGDVNAKASPYCWVLDEQSNQFVPLSKIPVDKLGRYHSVCETEVGFAITGGIDSDICVQYSVSTKTWSNMKHMLENRCLHGSFFRKGVIYVIGGWISGSMSKSVQCLDIACGDWECVLELPIGLKVPKVAALNDSAYILDEETRRLMRMDVEKKTCVELSPLPSNSSYLSSLLHGPGKCYGVSMTTVNNKLCVAGSQSRRCAMYDPDTDGWCEIQKPNQWHVYGSLIFYQEKLFLFGGKWSTGCSDDVEEYSFVEKKWSTSKIVMFQSLSLHYSFVLDIPQE